MSDRKICIAVDSLVNEPKDIPVVVDFLRRRDVARYVGSLKFTAEMMMDFHNIDPFVQLTSDSRVDSYSVVADLSLSGGYKAMLKTVQFVRQRVNRRDMTFTFSQLNSKEGIDKVVEAERASHPETSFLLTGVLPENDLDDFAEDFFGCSPEEFTGIKVKRSKEIEGVVGVYGSAEFAHLRNGEEYLGSGVTLIGGDYGTGLDEKRSLGIRAAYENCTSVVLGHSLMVHEGIDVGFDRFIASLD